MAGPKMAALAAAVPAGIAGSSLFTLESQGVALIYGSDATAIEVASRLAETLDVTVILRNPNDVTPPASAISDCQGAHSPGAARWANSNWWWMILPWRQPSSRASLAFGNRATRQSRTVTSSSM